MKPEIEALAWKLFAAYHSKHYEFDRPSPVAVDQATHLALMSDTEFEEFQNLLQNARKSQIPF